ncbi:STA10 protein, partial [Steatornis caripensis]|nr:STA10 protein [Steatornis caripensis]
MLHDIGYQRKRDTNVIDTRDIARVAANARHPKPLKNRDVVTLRSWRVEDGYSTIIDLSVKTPGRWRLSAASAQKHPPRKDLAWAAPLLPGYLVHSAEPASCSLSYPAQVAPKG